MDFDERIRVLRDAIEQRILGNPAQTALHGYNAEVQAFHDWCDGRRREADAWTRENERARAELAASRQRIAELDATLEQTRRAQSVDTYNAQVMQRNAAVAELNARTAALEAEIEAGNGRIKQFNDEQAERARQLDALRAKVLAEIRDHEEWLRKDGALAFANEVNELFRDAARVAEGSPHAMAATLAAIRDLRRTLGQHAQREQAENQQGMLIVCAELLSSRDLAVADEPVYLCVDTASSLSAISPVLVEALGLEEMLGEEVGLRLVNGIKIQAKAILLPRIRLGEAHAELVEGVVLRNDIAGVDGILGLSFLSRFDFRIERDRPLRMHLAPRARQDGFRYDVFIAHKTADLEYARQVYEWLVSQNYAVFFTGETSREATDPRFQREIDEGLETSAHLIVVASAAAHVAQGWVESEWRKFELLRMDDAQHRRHIIPVLCGSMRPEQLPLGLRSFAALRIDTPGWQPKLLRLLQQGS